MPGMLAGRDEPGAIRSVATHRAKKNRFQTDMHFSFYLMIAALVLMGLQLAYAFYQLAAFVL